MTAYQSPSKVDLRTGFGVVGPNECVELLASVPLGRVAFTVERDILILPVNFLWFDDAVVFRTLEGQKMDAALFGQPVAFEADAWDEDERTGWSVLIKGFAHRVNEWAEVETLEREGLVPWSRREWRPYWVRIEPTEITGRRLI